jgi:hypothetical protein
MATFQNQGPQDAPPGSAYSPGPQLYDPTLNSQGGGHVPGDNITAHAGGGRASATKISGMINRVTTAATLDDSVALPPAVGGQMIIVCNAGLAAITVYAAVGTNDTINGVAAATGVNLAVATTAMFCSSTAGVWFWIKSS